MPDIWRNQIALVPAHRQCRRTHNQAGVSQFTTQPRHRGQFRPDQSNPIRHQRQNKQHAHPHHQRLTGKHITQAKNRLAACQITRIPRNRQQTNRRYRCENPLQWSPEPAEQHDGNHTANQNTFFIDIHQPEIFHATVSEQRHHQQRKNAIAPG